MRSRRLVWLLLAAAAVAITALGAKAFWLEPASLSIDNQQIVVPASGLPSLRIAVLTDLHVGSPFNGIDNLRRVVDLTNAAQPDIICILGDLVIQGVRGGHFVPPEQIAAELKGLQPADRVFGVLGNHDGWLDHDRVARAMRDNGVHLVEDSAKRIVTRAGPLWIAGISDLWTGKHDLEAAIGSIANHTEPAILLTHSPDIFPDVPARIALTLAGHTHGGQVRFPFIGAPIVPSKFRQRFAAGHIVEGGRHLFVATGVGTSILPVRFRVPPSVTLLTTAAR